MVRDIQQINLALGTGEEKFISRGEILNREVLGKSLVATRQIKLGEKITADMVAVKGPALGLSPQRYPELIGQTSTRVIEVDEPYTDRDLGVNFELDVEHTLPLEWGFTVRFRDFEDILKYHPQMLEFHFTDQDLDEHYPGGDHEIKLVVHAPEFFERTLVDLCTPDERQRTQSVSLIQKTINLTRVMAPHFVDVPKVIVHTGGMSLDNPIKNSQVLYDNLRTSLEELDYADVELLLENLPPHPWYFGGQWLTNAFMDAREICDFIKPLGLNMCFDTSHSKLYSNWAHVDFYEQVKILLPYINHLHLSDGAGLDGEGLQIGEGTIDWVHFFEVIGAGRPDGYHGTMIPEIWRGHQRGNEGFVIAIKRLSEAYSKAEQRLESSQTAA